MNDEIDSTDDARPEADDPLAAGLEIAFGAFPSTRDVDSPRAVPGSEKAGEVIDRYKLLEKLGEGGFGAVWAAEQREPVKRRVALKVIKLGMDTKQTLARFEAERQALALMDHPNIARVLDAGATKTGRPYFVMELVKGIPITTFCEHENLPVVERLELFVKTCHAIQHAHQKGIIHRDIKPSNIMVTLHDGVPVPKVIDFGIAKATQQELTEKTIYTQYSEFIGTPAYMSPEQAELSGLDIDTRSDVYSLGVLLYELLTGCTPFDTTELLESGLDEMRRIIRETEPPKPSTRLTKGATTASAVDPDRRSPQRTVSKDLDWIVMKCLEKDRARRYDTANGLAMDIRRLLTNEPILARPPSAAYRLAKAWKRNKVVVTAAALVVVALVAGLTASLWQASEATMARNRAVRAEEEKEIQRKDAVDAREVAERSAFRAGAQRYAADVAFAQAAIAEGNLGRARYLLNALSPTTDDQNDFRGFEWRYLMGLARGRHTRAIAVSDTPIWHSALAPDASALMFKSPKVKSLKILDLSSETLRDTSIDDFRLVRYSPDGESIIVWEVGRQKELELIDRDTMTTTLKVKHIIGPPSPDGRWVVTRPPDSPTTLFDLVNRKPAGTLPYEDQLIQVLEPGAWILATNNTCCKWHVKGARIVSLTGEYETLSWPESNTVAWEYSPVSKRLVIGDGDARVFVYDLTSGKELFRHRIVHCKAGAVNAVTITRDGKMAAVATWEAVVGLIDLETGDMTYVGETAEDDGWEPVVALRKRGTGELRYIEPRDSESGEKRVPDHPTVQSGPRLESESYTLAFTADGKTLVTGNKDGHFRFWDVDPPRATAAREDVLHIPRGNSMGQVPFSRNGALFAVSSADSTSGEKEIRVYKTKNFRRQVSFRSAATPIAFLKDDRFVVTIHSLGLEHWDLRSGTVAFRAGFPEAKLDGGYRVDRAVTDASGRAVLVPDGKEAAILVRLRDGVVLERVTDLAMSNLVMAVAPDLRQVAVDSGFGEVDLYRFVRDGLAQKVASGSHKSNLHSMAFTPDATGLIGGSHGDLVYRELDSWRSTEMGGHLSQTITAVAVSPDSRTGASVATQVKLWNLTTRREVVSLDWPEKKGSTTVGFDPTGKFLMAVGIDDKWLTARVWEAPALEEIVGSSPLSLIEQLNPRS